MPGIDSLPTQSDSTNSTEEARHFPPVTREHILHCSYDHWFPRYRTSCIRSRIIRLSPDFVEYIKEDRIILADDDDVGAAGDEDDWEPTPTTSRPRAAAEEDGAAGPDSDSDSDSDDAPAAQVPPNHRFPELHQTIKDKIHELGGAVAPKLNWSAPKDASWISPHQNTMKCTSPNDVYLLLKSSSFVSHDLENAFDSCPSLPPSPLPPSSSFRPNPPWLEFTPVLVLRSFFSPLPSLEFRCFVKDRTLVGITQRDLNHYEFLDALRPAIVACARELFNRRLRFTFPEGSFAFDIYVPEADYDDGNDNRTDSGNRLGRARLIDINPWAPHTDTLLFDWAELLNLRVPEPVLGSLASGEAEAEGGSESSDGDDDEDHEYDPEVRLVEKDDPAAHNFSTPQYSAHKLPKEVVDASMSGEGGMRDFAQTWQRIVEGGGR